MKRCVLLYIFIFTLFQCAPPGVKQVELFSNNRQINVGPNILPTLPSGTPAPTAAPFLDPDGTVITFVSKQDQLTKVYRWNGGNSQLNELASLGNSEEVVNVVNGQDTWLLFTYGTNPVRTSAPLGNVWLINKSSGAATKLEGKHGLSFGAIFYQGNYVGSFYDTAKGTEFFKLTEQGQFSLLKDIESGTNDSSPYGFTLFNNKVYFSAYTVSGGYELYSWDGQQVKLISDLVGTSGVGSHPQFLVNYQDTLYFYTFNRVATSGTKNSELRSMGNDEQIQTISTNYYNQKYMVVWENSLWMSCSSTAVTNSELCKGTKASSGGNFSLSIHSNIETTLGGSNPSNFLISNHGLYFSAFQKDYGVELWRVPTGQSTAAERITDLMPGQGNANPKPMFATNSGIYFSAFHPIYGEELFFYNKNTKTTNVVLDLAPGKSSSFPQILP